MVQGFRVPPSPFSGRAVKFWNLNPSPKKGADVARRDLLKELNNPAIFGEGKEGRGFHENGGGVLCEVPLPPGNPSPSHLEKFPSPSITKLHRVSSIALPTSTSILPIIFPFL
jgi:hypothetical protein